MSDVMHPQPRPGDFDELDIDVEIPTPEEIADTIARVESASQSEPQEPETLLIEPLPEVMGDFSAEKLQARIDKAVEAVEVEPTPEVIEAITGYYTDHYELAGVIDDILSGSLSSDVVDALLERRSVVSQDKFPKASRALDYASGGAMPNAESESQFLAYLWREYNAQDQGPKKDKAYDRLMRAVGHGIGSIFSESSLPRTTTDDQEIDIVVSLQDRYINTVERLVQESEGKHPPTTSAVVSEGRVVAWPYNFSAGVDAPDWPPEPRWHRLEYKHKPPDREKYASSVEYAKQAVWDDSRHAGQLLYHNTGHFGDMSRSGYLRPRTEQFRQQGEMRIQMASHEKMHSVVPHWSEEYDPRGYKMGDTRDASRQTGTGTVAVAIGDVVGEAAYARDAKFGIVVPRENSDPDVPLNVGTTFLGVGNPDYPGRWGADRVFFAAVDQDEGQPDGYGIRLDQRTTFIFHGQKEISASELYGLGESFPGRVEIQEEDDPLDAIVQLQAEYLANPQYSGKLVVPLRRGVLNYAPENTPTGVGNYRELPNYDTNPTDDRKS